MYEQTICFASTVEIMIIRNKMHIFFSKIGLYDLFFLSSICMILLLGKDLEEASESL